MPPKSENIFDLSRLGATSNDIEIKNTKTAQDNTELLNGYEEVAADDWPRLSEGTHIRYSRGDGTFLRSGYIRRLWQTDNTIYMEIGQQMAGPKSWQIKQSSIDQIWKRSGPTAHIISRPLQDDTEERIQYCEKTLKAIIVELQKINNEHKRIISYIAKLSQKR